MDPSLRRLVWPMLAFALVISSRSEAQNQHDMAFHTIPQCTVVDTRVAGGPFTSGETRTYNVVGGGSLAAQGGSSTGCGIPGFSNGIAQVQAVVLVITAISPTGTTHIAAYAADQSPQQGVLTFNAGDLITNTSQVAVAQTAGVGDIKVFLNFYSAHVMIQVVGYYSKPVQTVYVHPVPGNHTASGTALLNAMSGITNASATKRYVIKLARARARWPHRRHGSRTARSTSPGLRSWGWASDSSAHSSISSRAKSARPTLELRCPLL